MSTSLKIFLVLLTAIFGFTAGLGISDSMTAAVITAILSGGVATWILWKFPIIQFEKSAYTRGLQILSIVGIVLALIQVSRLAVFMVDPTEVNFSTIPWSQWEAKHSCLSAYFVAAESVKKVPDVYANSLYSMPDDSPNAVRKPRMLGVFRIDVFEYPPPFLILPKAITSLTNDFLRVRLLWFAFNGIVILIAMLIIARSLGPIIGTRAQLLIPVVWAGLPTVNTLQKGNVQLLIVCLSMIAMLLISRKKFLSGSILLAFTTASKIYPGMLIVYLLVRRQWRAIIYTAIAGITLTLIALYAFGLQSYEAFLKHLPGILGGEAFPAFRNPHAMAINVSIPGIIFKLKIFGVQGFGFGTSKIVGWIYTLILLAIIFVVARRKNDNPLAWLSILILATLRSPFLPASYATFPPLWLLSLIIAFHSPTPKTLLTLILGWVCLNISIPNDSVLDPRIKVFIMAIPQLVIIALALIGLKRTEQSTAIEESSPNVGRLIMSENG
jgi:alpha-1,2-mannosyltransferase